MRFQLRHLKDFSNGYCLVEFAILLSWDAVNSTTKNPIEDEKVDFDKVIWKHLGCVSFPGDVWEKLTEKSEDKLHFYFTQGLGDKS